MDLCGGKSLDGGLLMLATQFRTTYEMPHHLSEREGASERKNHRNDNYWNYLEKSIHFQWKIWIWAAHNPNLLYWELISFRRGPLPLIWLTIETKSTRYIEYRITQPNKWGHWRLCDYNRTRDKITKASIEEANFEWVRDIVKRTSNSTQYIPSYFLIVLSHKLFYTLYTCTKHGKIDSQGAMWNWHIHTQALAWTNRNQTTKMQKSSFCFHFWDVIIMNIIGVVYARPESGMNKRQNER